VAVTEVLKPVGILRRGPGTTLLDFGQHMTGRVRLRVRDGRPGDVVTVRHAEALAPDGSLYTASLRTARQEDRFVLGGGSVETLVPQFVVHGFRYAEVHGHAGRIDEADVDVEVAHSALRPAARLRSANPLLERLQQNVVWSLRANFIDIPVDCAQRDERLGWTGDINLFTPTALATADCATFLRSWLRSLADAQQPSGAVPDVAPYLNQPLPPRDINEGQPGWADAIVEMPWEIYLHTGDERVLEEAWRPVVRWLDYLVADGRLVRPVGVFGDWNTLDARTPSDLLGTVWFARAARGAAAIAHALGESEKQREYDQLYTAIRAAFQERFVAGDGSVAGETQTAYATALDAELVPAELVETAGARLVDAIASSGWHLTTGFVGTACVLHVLTALGRSDAAYRVLAQTTFPSWGFQLLNGATAMWEHWDSWRPETGFQNPKMNSFNHFAFASVGAWLYRGAAGINPDPERPGYRRIRFTPHPDTWPRELALDLDTPSGRVSSGWWTDGRTARLTLAVPPNAEGVLELPWVADARSVDVAPWSAAGEVEAAERGVRVPLGPGATVLRAPHPPRDSSDA
jgi:alpha-L-rhamnosidase